MQKVAHEKSFLNLSDAQEWMYDIIDDWGRSGWEVEEGTVLRRVNFQWQVFINLKRQFDR